jgi:hypothetical protein
MAIFRHYNFIFKNIAVKDLVTNPTSRLKSLPKTEIATNDAIATSAADIQTSVNCIAVV